MEDYNVKLDQFIEKLQQCEYIQDDKSVKELCEKAKEILSKEENVIYLNAPITVKNIKKLQYINKYNKKQVCGDIHGQFYDLIELFKHGGEVTQTNYLFLGDFVDRGYNSVETFLLLLCLKVRYPQRVALLRGNHESRQITQVYGFYDECLRKYGSSNVWKYCTDVFDMLTLAAVINNKVFCVHGGLSPQITTITDVIFIFFLIFLYVIQIKNINRFQEIPHCGPMCDFLWSDPEDIDDWENNPRGAGVIFGVKVVDKFLKTNNFELIVRAHQLIMEGYKIHFDNKLITIWSAPNYCYRCNNVAAILQLDENLKTSYITFNAAPEDYKPAPEKKPLPEYFL